VLEVVMVVVVVTPRYLNMAGFYLFTVVAGPRLEAA